VIASGVFGVARHDSFWPGDRDAGGRGSGIRLPVALAGGLLIAPEASGTEALARHFSEVEYQTLVEVLPVASYTCPLDTAHSKSYISPEIEVMLGYPRHEWKSNPALRSEVLYEADREWVSATPATPTRVSASLRSRAWWLAITGSSGCGTRQS
jgi:hypothetical protein